MVVLWISKATFNLTDGDVIIETRWDTLDSLDHTQTTQTLGKQTERIHRTLGWK